ncbi:MAG: Uma2 family endonuclease, partial [Candidatus Acidiferrum sp.]
VLYMASPENTDANQIFRWLFAVLGIYVRKKRLGDVFGSRVACRLDNSNSPEPDLFFVAARNRARVKRGGVEGPPDVAVEIVSPESVDRDYGKKRKQYERFGVSEYWIIDEYAQKMIVFKLDSYKKYREVPPRKKIHHSQVITGFRLDPRWLWQDPLPDELEVLQHLLETK